MLFGPAIGLGRALVQAQHELKVLVRFLLVRQRPVVGTHVPQPGAAAPQRGPAGREQLPVVHGSGAGGAKQVEEGGHEEETQKASCGAGRPHVCVKSSGASELHQRG